MIVRRGSRSRYLGAAFRATDSTDLVRLADATGTKVEELPESIGGLTVDLTDPRRSWSGLSPTPTSSQLCRPSRRRCSTSGTTRNANTAAPASCAKIQRLGHIVLQTTRYVETLNWYLEHLGLIVSDFKYYEGQA